MISQEEMNLAGSFHTTISHEATLKLMISYLKNFKVFLNLDRR